MDKNQAKKKLEQLIEKYEDRLRCAYTEEEYYNTPVIINVVSSDVNFPLLFLVAILNSKLIAWYHKKTSPKANKGLFPKILVSDVRKIIIPKCDDQSKKTLEQMAKDMITLNNNLNRMREGTNEYQRLKDQSNILDRKIDQVIYKLYDLNSAEIKIVEDSM